ncbi:lipoyltransferase 1, mitochondrial-like isoform X2 [Daphnia pulicaria]|uniref:lipoyltransferase 1, mitochondrial-like isoform X2 n=1 Tax=Daphnia pulicaria TaxID=35523 RepID=UPI001EEC02E9|nr:lipoyltransferase 1, mitochondrial-like isoform X2 [Daphnia pulicaria]
MTFLRYRQICFFRQFRQGKTIVLRNMKLSTIASQSFHNDVSKKLVFVSKSTNIFENLAIEDWLYKNFDFETQSLLFIVVIGRHQNPWVEVNLKNMSENGVFLSRRNSGGGTVYHDRGNLNCSFFSSRARYNRKSNLENICQSMKCNWNLDLTISPREDILLNSYKVSGTASKLGHKNAYHHCTLLVDVDSTKLHHMLKVDQLGIKSNSTPSVRSPTLNLKSICSQISVDEIIQVLGNYYTRNSSAQFEGLINFVEPSEEKFPGIDMLKLSFSNWHWTYGKTPSFVVCWPLGEQSPELSIVVQNGQIERLDFQNMTIDKEHSRKLSELLLNQKLDNNLYNKILSSNVFEKMNDNCAKLKEMLFLLCLTSV